MPLYRQPFGASFPGDGDPITLDNLTKALAAFQRTFLSGDSPYDRFRRGNAGAIPESAKRGELLFRADRLKCAACHSGILFTKDVDTAAAPAPTLEFVNTGLYNIGGAGAYPANNTGIYEHTRQPSDMGRFKIPTLRNIALTYPYMHDGTAATLDDVLDHTPPAAAHHRRRNAGDGSRNPYKSPLIGGFTLTRRSAPTSRVPPRPDGFVVHPESKLANPWIAAR